MPIPFATSDEEDVKRRVKEAIAFYRVSGKRIGLAEFMDRWGGFVENNLYVFAMDLKGRMLAHPFHEEFVGRDCADIDDSDGRSFVREILENAERDGQGFVRYKWHDPASGEELLKTVYFEKSDDIILCSGFYGSAEMEEYPEDYFELLQYLGA